MVEVRIWLRLLNCKMYAITWIICIGYITRCRCLCDLHTEDRRPRGCVNREDTEPSDITDLYYGTRDHRDASLS